jgi:hypothetical protein
MTVEQANGDTLNQLLRASEKLAVHDQLRLISLLSERLRLKVNQGDGPVDMLTLAGLGAELWREIDVAAYLEQERSSWTR